MKDVNGTEIKVGDVVKNTSNDVGIVVGVNKGLSVKLSEWFIDNNFAFWGKGKTEDVVVVLKPKECEMRFNLKK